MFRFLTFDSQVKFHHVILSYSLRFQEREREAIRAVHYWPCARETESKMIRGKGEARLQSDQIGRRERGKDLGLRQNFGWSSIFNR